MKRFKLMVANPMVTLYDMDLNEVVPKSVDGERRVYELRGYWNEELEMYVTPAVLAVEIRDAPFRITVDVLRCMDGIDKIYSGILCVNGVKKLKSVLMGWDRSILKAVVERLL